MLYLLCHGDLQNSLHANRRARRLMLNIIAKTPVTPPSLFVMRVGPLTDLDFIDVGRFGLVYKAELHRKLVALKVLHRAYNNTVSCSCRSYRKLRHPLFTWKGRFSGGIDVAIPQSQIPSTILRNLRRRISITIISCLAIYGEWHSGSMAEERKSINSSDRTTGRLLFLSPSVEVHYMQDIGSCSRHHIHPCRRRSSWWHPRGILPEI